MIEVRRRRKGRDTIVMVECPVCDQDLRDKHVSYHFEVDHGPEDFGLAPLGEVERLAD